jgi:hypothetical protein
MGGLEAPTPRTPSRLASVVPERPARSRTAAERARGSTLSAVPQHRRADVIAGFLCAFSLAVAGIATVRTPALLAPAAILLALVAARMSDVHRTLAAWAVGLGTVAFIVGMTVAVLTDSPLY